MPASAARRPGALQDGGGREVSVIKTHPLLGWPSNWPRTAPRDRLTGPFRSTRRISSPTTPGFRKERLTTEGAAARVVEQCRRVTFKLSHVHMMFNEPLAETAAPEDPGAVVYWWGPKSAGYSCIAIDRFDHPADNLAAIASALRAFLSLKLCGGDLMFERALGSIDSFSPKDWPAFRDVFAARRRVAEQAPALLALAKQYASECGDCAGTRVCPDDSPCTECVDIWRTIDKAEGRDAT